MQFGHCQKINNNQIEVYPYYSFGITFSKLKSMNSNSANYKFNSPPVLNGFNYGLKIERKFFKDTMGIYLNTAISYLNLSVTGKYNIRTKDEGIESEIGVVPDFGVWSVGLKKRLNRKVKRLNTSLEIGIRSMFIVHSENPDFNRSTLLSDTLLTSSFIFQKERNFTLVPYISSGLDYKIKEFKIGVQFWAQRALQPIYEYDFNVVYGSKYFHSKSISNGLAIGFNLYVKILAF